ncbi:PD-(D/E)XK nuclease family protein [Candidatus Pacearchaeota archaeon]|nr:PD-(D/E)XK nuclease family protein [Candidatus Pacearchaeota archaeon]
MGDDYLNSYDNAAKGKRYITSSQIGTFCECGVAYRKSYIERLKTGSGSGAVFGTAGHFAENEINLRQKIKSKVDVPVDVVQDAFRDRLQGMKGDIEWNKAERKEGVRKLWREMKETGIVAMERLHLDLAPKIQPISIEAKIVIPLKNFPIDIMGTWDVECRRDLWDFKFKKKTPTQNDADKNLGFTLYAMAKTVKDGKPPRSIKMAGIVRLKRGPKTFEITTKRTEDDFRRVLLTVNKIEKSIQAGIFLPASPLSWKCAPAWCGHYETCAERLSG